MFELLLKSLLLLLLFVVEVLKRKLIQFNREKLLMRLDEPQGKSMMDISSMAIENVSFRDVEFNRWKIKEN